MNVPSPAGPDYADALRDSPWLATLDRAYRFKCGEAERYRAELIRLRVSNETLRRRLRDAKRRQLLWEERQEVWRARERELEGRHA